MNVIKIGKFIREQRLKAGLTQVELAKKINVTDKSVSKWENGNGLMDISLLQPLSEVLNVKVQDILNGKIVDEDINKYETEIEKKYNAIKNKLFIARIKHTLIFILIIITIFLYIISKFKFVEEFYINEDEISKNLIYHKENIFVKSNNLSENNTIKISNLTFANFFNSYPFHKQNHMMILA